jgi:excinuclease UvrABC ATPase subunit
VRPDVDALHNLSAAIVVDQEQMSSGAGHDGGRVVVEGTPIDPDPIRT